MSDGVSLQEHPLSAEATVRTDEAAAAAAAAAARQESIERLAKKIAGIAAIYFVEKGVGRGLQQAKLKIPSSLATMLLWIGGLKALEEIQGDSTQAEAVSEALAPAVGFYGKWMTLFLTPPLTMLPMAIKTHAKGTSGRSWRRLAAIHAVGWFFSLLISAGVAHMLRRRSKIASSSTDECCNERSPATTVREGSTIQGGAEAAAGGVNSEKATKREEEKEKEGSSEGGEDLPVISTMGPTQAPTTVQVTGENDLLHFWFKVSLAAYALHKVVGRKPAMAATTITAIIGASTVLPKTLTKIAHPVVVAAATTASSIFLTAQSQGLNVDDTFIEYMNGGGILAGGAGDSISGLMNAAVSALGIRMFDSRKVLEENWQPLVGGAGLSALFGLFSTAYAAGQAELPKPLGLALTQRSVMSALGIAGAQILETSPNLAVASILLTGVYGASLGGIILDAIGIKAGGGVAKDKAGRAEGSREEEGEEEEEEDVSFVTRGVAMGASAHAIGTASLMAKEPDAAAVSSVSLCVAGIVHTVVLSLPSVQKLIHEWCTPADAARLAMTVAAPR